MKRFKVVFLIAMLLSFGLVSNSYARERNGSGGRREDREYGSRGYRSRREKSGGFGGPKLDYDGRTSGIGREIGGIVGGAIGSRKGGKVGNYLGQKIGGRVGDSWERRMNQRAHDKWNNKGRHGNTSWRVRLDDEEDYEN